MSTRRTRRIAVIGVMAAVCFGLAASGCITKRDIEEVKNRLTAIEDQNQRTLRMVQSMDSTVITGAESDNRLRNEIRVSSENMQQQIAQLLENYNDLMARIDQMNQQEVIKLPPRSSPGSQSEAQNADTASPPPAQALEADCIAAYDDAFILTRNSEYEKAIGRFQEFLQSCEKHENASNAHYWIGECYYAMGDFAQAVAEFELLLNDYPSSAKVAPTLYKLARSKQELGKTDEARQLFQRVIEEHPGTLEAEQAKQRVRDLR